MRDQRQGDGVCGKGVLVICNDCIGQLVNRVIALEAVVIKLHNAMSLVLIETGKLMEMAKERQLYGDKENDRS